jgi:hypothetical protein
MPHKANDSRRHKFPKMRYRIDNWRAYDAALRDRGDLTVWVTPEALAAWHPVRTGRRGRSPTYSDLVIETGMMLRLAFGRPWRQTEGLLRSVAQMMNLAVGIPDHITLSRCSAAMPVALDLTGAKEPVHVVIDSTGLKVYGAGEWHRDKHGGRRSGAGRHPAAGHGQTQHPGRSGAHAARSPSPDDQAPRPPRLAVGHRLRPSVPG